MVLAPYRTNVFRGAALEPLRAAGVRSSDITFDVRFANGVVIGEATFLRSVTVGQQVLQLGHVVRCFRSRRFVTEEVTALFARGGWNVCAAVEDAEHEHAVVVAERGIS